MFELSDWAANIVYNTANVLVVIAAVVGGIGAIGLFWGGSWRDLYNERRTAAHESKTAEANKAAAQANEGLAKANLEIENRKKENLRLSLVLMHSLQELRQRKMVSDSRTLREMFGINVELIAIPEEEATQVALDIGMAAELADWVIADFKFADQQTTVHSGVSVRYGVHDVIGQRASELLVEALRISGLTARRHLHSDLPPKTVRVLVGRNDKLDAVLDILNIDGMDEGINFEPTHSMPYMRWNQEARKARFNRRTEPTKPDESGEQPQ